MAPITEFTVLKCACGGDLFTPIVRLKYRTDGGTIKEPAGDFCVACHAVVDNAYMARLVDHARKRDEIKRLQTEIADVPAPPEHRSVAPTLVTPPR